MVLIGVKLRQPSAAVTFRAVLPELGFWEHASVLGQKNKDIIGFISTAKTIVGPP